jgi:hypothetical protein
MFLNINKFGFGQIADDVTVLHFLIGLYEDVLVDMQP